MYSPFNKPLIKLNIKDLKLLLTNDISEGWYIEYKRDVPKLSGKLDNNKIAKSISSFANTKGGWIFWGIECTDNKPTSICGVDLKGYRNFEDQISQIIN